MPFQRVAGRFGSRVDVSAAQAALPLSPVFFDVLSVDGRDLLELPGEQRHTELARLVPERLRVRRQVVGGPVRRRGPRGRGGLLVRDPAPGP